MSRTGADRCPGHRRVCPHRDAVWGGRSPVGFRLGIVTVVLAVAACSAGGTSEFDRAASSASSTLFAAATTLEFARTGKATIAYARAAFVEYGDGLDSVGEQLPTMSGAPANVDQLARLVSSATAIVADPCLDGSCDWPGQIRTLEAAGSALAQASSTAGSGSGGG